jgi:chromosome segregation ATPase
MTLPPSTSPAHASAPASALERVAALLDVLEAAVDARLDREAEFADADAEVQRMNVDRARLAQELDTAEARAERLADVNREVSRRLVAAMETIRAVIDR